MAPSRKLTAVPPRPNSPMPNRSLGNELEVAMAVYIIEVVPLAMTPPFVDQYRGRPTTP